MLAKEQSALERLSAQMIDLQLMFWAVRHKNRVDDPHDLTELEFMTLDALVRKGSCTVGELQKALDVQPAQMSRLIRALESESKGPKTLVSCQLNSKDKRRIDVTITPQGQQAHNAYRSLRMQANKGLVKGLSEGEQNELAKLMDRFGEIMSAQLAKEE